MISKKSNNAINIISWISIVAIAVTTGALIVILSAMNGLTNIVANLYNSVEPDIRITAAKGKYFQASDKFMKDIQSTKGVGLISQSLSDKILVKNVDKQALVTLKGVDKNFSKIAKIDSVIIEGAYGLNEGGQGKILLGRGIANQLSVNLKVFVNELCLYSPLKGEEGTSLNPQDNLNQVYCTPSGIFSLNDELDNEFAFVSLKTARDLFDLQDKVSALEISCTGSIDKVKDELQKKLGSDFVIKNRYELNDVLFKALETEKLATFIILAFILVIATFNIIGALTMLIIEKRKDIKTLYSMGANLGLIRSIFMREAFLISGLGAFIGLALGLLVCWLQIQFHLVTFGSEFIVPYYPIQLQIKDFIWIFGLIMLIGFFAALYPVRVFTKTDLVH